MKSYVLFVDIYYLYIPNLTQNHASFACLKLQSDHSLVLRRRRRHSHTDCFRFQSYERWNKSVMQSVTSGVSISRCCDIDAEQCCNEYSDSDSDSNLFLRIPNIRIRIRDFCRTNNIQIRIRNRILTSESESF